VNPLVSIAKDIITETQAAARAKGLQLQIVKASNEIEIETGFRTITERRAGALVVGPDALFVEQRDRLIALASRHAVPTIYHLRLFSAAGGLISYGSDRREEFREAGLYIGKILNGARPEDLPVMQPTKFELVINLKTARELGVAVPQTLLARANEVIE
jgi:putative tryptophan/tyrosine transport system substrate-binding protein